MIRFPYLIILSIPSLLLEFWEEKVKSCNPVSDRKISMPVIQQLNEWKWNPIETKMKVFCRSDCTRCASWTIYRSITIGKCTSRKWRLSPKYIDVFVHKFYWGSQKMIKFPNSFNTYWYHKLSGHIIYKNLFYKAGYLKVSKL